MLFHLRLAVRMHHHRRFSPQKRHFFGHRGFRVSFQRLPHGEADGARAGGGARPARMGLGGRCRSFKGEQLGAVHVSMSEWLPFYVFFMSF